MNEYPADRGSAGLPQPAAGGSIYRGENAEAAAWRGSVNRKEAFTLRDLLVVAFYHRRLILLAALVPILAAVAAAVLVKTTYTADGLMMVLVNREVSGNQNVTDSGPAVLSIEGLKSVQSEVEIITSAGVIRQTIQKIGLERLYPELVEGRFNGLVPPVAEERRPDKAIELFRRDLKANVESDSNIVRIAYRHPDRAIAIAVVDTLVDAYRERRRAVFDNPRAPFLAGEVVRFKQQLEETDAAILKVKADHDVIDIDQDRILAANQVDSVVQRHRQVSERRAATTAQLAEAERQVAALPQTVFDFRQKSDAVTNDDDRNLLTRLQVDRERLAAQYAPGYPAIQELDQKIAAVRRAMNSRELKISTASRDVRNPAVSYMSNMILNLRVERDALDNQLVELGRQKEAAEARVAALRIADGTLIDLHRRRDVLDDSYRQYVKRAEAAKIEEDAAQVRSSNVRVVQQADAPITGRNMRLPFLAAGLTGGLLFGAAAGAFGAWLRRSFIMPTEAERALQIPALAEFTDAGGRFDGAGAQPALAHFASLLLDTAVDDRTLRIVQLVSVGDEEGRRPLARALAEEIATGRGLRTLLIDCGDGRDRGQGLPARPGSTGTSTLAVATSGVPLLWLASDVARSAMTSLRAPLADARRQVEALRQEYDVVVISAPAQGLSHLTQRLAAIVDANILVVRAEVSRAPAVTRLRDMILEAGGGLLGFVFTGRKYYIPRWVYRWL